MQQPDAIFMVRPAAFGFNAETADSNAFQTQASGDHRMVLDEFDRMVDMLRSHEIDVRVFDDTPLPVKPDAVFPNNWISTHADGTVILYPMMAPNRRTERRTDVIDAFRRDFVVRRVVDLSSAENNAQFLEGTGSMVIDHVNQVLYACRSPRTSQQLVDRVASELNFRAILFDAVDESGKPVYHTNVVMAIGQKFVLLCIDAVKDEADQESLLDSFARTDHKVIAISHAQMKAFAGNAIEVKNQNGEPVVLMSQTAFNSLLPGQINAIAQFADIIPLSIPTIEKIGGGSVRCMVAGIHLQRSTA